MNNKDFEDRVLMTAEVLKMTLNMNNLYLGVSTGTEEFIFVDRDDYHKGNKNLGRINMDSINSMEDK